MNRRMWSVNSKELRGQLLVLAIVAWGLAAINTFTAGPSYRTGQVKGTDFLQFYARGSLAAEGRGDVLYDSDAQRAEQERLVPASKGIWFLPIQGPQTALLFAGLSRLPYLWALLIWETVTILLYGTCVWALWRQCPTLGVQARLVGLAAVGFPPFYALVLYGQVSVLPMACVTLAFLALRAHRKWWAGVAFGALAIKPQLGVAVAVVMLARREWRVIGGAIAAIGAQWGMSALAFGTGPLIAYGHMLLLGPRLADLLEPEPFMFHSLRAFWTLLSPRSSVALALYALTSGAALALTVRLWRTSVALEIRYSALILATILVAPHVGIYELVVLAPAFVLTASESERMADPRRRVFRALLYLGYLAPLFGPLAGITHLQLSVPVFAAWLVALHWAAFREFGRPGAAQPADVAATPRRV